MDHDTRSEVNSSRDDTDDPVVKFYRQQRAVVSFLRSEGHPAASRYPLAYAWNEAAFARQRINGRIATETVLIHAAIVQAIAGGEHLKTTMEKLTDGRK
jgi:hypothetical protein